jgi:hypothetical protein
MLSPGPDSKFQELEQRPVGQLFLMAACVFVLWAHTYSSLNVYLLPKILYFVAGALIVIVLGHRWRGAGRVAPVLLLDVPALSSPSQWSRRIWLFAGLLLLIAALIFLEFRQPYYFTEDDDMSQFLPGILLALRGSAAVFPSWNPYQFLGSPNSSIGTYALTYPPTWFSYWFAKSLLHNENATIDVFVILHLLVAYAVIYWLIRREDVRPALATLGALCCTLSGWALIVGRSWYYMTPVFVWMPLLIICLRTACRQRLSWKWIVGCGLTIGVYAHAGNVQMWAYSILLLGFAAVLMLWTRVLPSRALTALTLSFLLGLIIAAPLLVPQWLATRHVSRIMWDGNVLHGLPSLFVPVSIIETPHPFPGDAMYRPYIGEMYYSGTFFCLIVPPLLFFLIFLRWGRRVVAQNLWFLCAMLSLLLALGNAGMAWVLLQHVPGFNKFNLAFKFFQLFQIFIVLAGALVWERLLRRWRFGFRAEFATAAVVVALLAHHCFLALPAFYTYGFKPYPSPDPTIAERLQPRDHRDYPRLFVYGAKASTDPGFFQSRQHQWAQLSGFFTLGGYDPLVSEDPAYKKIDDKIVSQSADTFRQYGVRYLIIFDRPWPKWLKVPANLVYTSGKTTMWELPPAKPMLWADADPNRALPVTFDARGADLDTSELPQGGWVTLNMLRRPEIFADAGNQPLTVVADSWNRIHIQVPPHTSRVRVRFTPAWKLGFAVSGVLACLMLLAAWIHRKFGKYETVSTVAPEREAADAVRAVETAMASSAAQ